RTVEGEVDRQPEAERPCLDGTERRGRPIMSANSRRHLAVANRPRFVCRIPRSPRRRHLASLGWLAPERIVEPRDTAKGLCVVCSRRVARAPATSAHPELVYAETRAPGVCMYEGYSRSRLVLGSGSCHTDRLDYL